LIGEKFRAALGIAAPVDVAALALQLIEFTKRIAAAAATVNASLRMGSPVGLVSLSGQRPAFGLASRAISLSIFPNNGPSIGRARVLNFFASTFEPTGPIHRHTRL
jgi:hypothetical protein